MSISFKDRHFLKDVILMAFVWYVAYSLSYRYIEKLMSEHRVNIGRSTINRWVIKYFAELLEKIKSKKKPVNRAGVWMKLT